MYAGSIFRAIAFGLAIISILATQVVAKPVVIGYYLSWKKTQSEGVDFSKYTHINMAFGIPTSSGTFSFDGDSFLPSVVSDLHSKGTKVLMSVGGWTGSNYFSNIVKSDSTSQALINSMVDYVDKNQLDGIDIDWEYPGRLGNTCNVFDTANDTPNYLKFLQSLRSAFDTKFGKGGKLITLAIRVEPFDVNGAPSTDVSEFAKVVDYGNLMQYDINGGWNNDTGPNAPFNFEKGKGLQVSFVSAIDVWTKAGWPASQLTAGLAFYGRSTIAKEDMTKDPTNQYQPQSSTVPLGDSEDASWFDACAGTTANSGTWQWKHLRDQGVLSSPDTAASPWVRQWDSVSQTPWLFNPSTKQFISYDDPASLKIKVDYAASKGLAGSMVWSINMDHNNELIDVLSAWGTDGSSSSSSNNDSTATRPANASPSVADVDAGLSGLDTSDSDAIDLNTGAGNIADSATSADSITNVNRGAIVATGTIDYGKCSDGGDSDSVRSTASDSKFGVNRDQLTGSSATDIACAPDYGKCSDDSNIDTDQKATFSYSTDTSALDADPTPAADTDPTSASPIINIAPGPTADAASSTKSKRKCRRKSSASATATATAGGDDGSAAISTNTAATDGGSGGASCSPDGAYVCEGASGAGSTYKVCVHGAWLTGLPCGPGTVCITAGDSIACGWPSS